MVKLCQIKKRKIFKKDKSHSKIHFWMNKIRKRRGRKISNQFR